MLPSPRRRAIPRYKAAVALIVTALLAGLAPSLAAPRPSAAAEAAPRSRGVVTRSSNASMTASLAKPATSIPPTATLKVTVAGSVAVPVDTLSVRLRVRRPSGRLLYQRTVERYEVKRGAFEVTFARELAGLDLKEGRYGLEAYVVADRLPPVELTDRLYVIKPGRKPVPLVVVTRFDHTPMMDPQGRFALDPARETRTRDEVVALNGLVTRAPWLKLTLGVAPLMLDEWRRTSGGYQLVSAGGVTTVDRDAPVVATYASALSALGRTAREERVQLLDVPYADPDLGGLRSMGAMEDLRLQYDRGFPVYRASLSATPSAGTASLGDSIPQSALPILVEGGVGHLLLRPNALAVSGPATATPGVYGVKGTRLRALVLDERAGRLLGDKTSSAEDLLDHLFEHLVSESSGQPLVASVHLGPGSHTDVASLERVLGELSRTGWVRFETAAEASGRKPAQTGTLKPSSSPGGPAPYGYWQELTLARTYARAFVDAVSERDEDAMEALHATFVAESRYWAGADNRWSAAARGRAFTDEALSASRQVLDKVSVTTQTITLSGDAGEIPLSIKNASGKTLSVFVVASASSARFPKGRRVRVTLRPADNYVTLPIDLGSGTLSEKVRVTVTSGRIALAETYVDVHASYLDRLALVALVVVLLGGLLLYIRHKVRSASADT